MQWRQMVPPLWVASLLGFGLLALWVPWFLKPLALVAGLYLAACLGASLWASARHGWRHLLFLPFTFPMLHLGYGTGFLLGQLRFWNRWRMEKKENPRPHHEELNRIRAEYARREREIPQDYYSPEHAGNRFIYEGRRSRVRKMLESEKILPLEKKKILEIGCGTGSWLADFESLLGYGFVHMMTATYTGPRIHAELGSGKHPLPAPFLVGIWILPFKRIR